MEMTNQSICYVMLATFINAVYIYFIEGNLTTFLKKVKRPLNKLLPNVSDNVWHDEPVINC